jgi:hypothetical protein
MAEAMTSSACPKLSGCAFINVRMKHMPGTVELAKKSYCHTERHEGCARYIMSQALRGPAIPDNLYPDQVERAHALITPK